MSRMIKLLQNDPEIGQYTNEIYEAYFDDIEDYKKKIEELEERIKTILFKLDVFGGCLLSDGERKALKMFRQVRKSLEEKDGE